MLQFIIISVSHLMVIITLFFCLTQIDNDNLYTQANNSDKDNLILFINLYLKVRDHFNVQCATKAFAIEVN